MTTRLLRGHIDTLTSDVGVRPIRCRAGDRDLLHPALLHRADNAAGIRLAAVTDSDALEVELTPEPENPQWLLDLVVNDELVESRCFGGDQRTTARFDIPGNGLRRVELYLPNFVKTTLHTCRFAEGSKVQPLPDDRPKWITYGSSITHCRAAHSPARSWPALVARLRGYDLTCLGFGGQCHFDPLMARTIAGQPTDLISLKLGINTHGAGTFNERSWAAAVLGFIFTVRDDHPDTPLLVISPIHTTTREQQPSPTGLTLPWMRDTLADLVQTLRARGDANLHYLSGHALLGPDHEADLQPDGVHPTADGYENIASRFCARAPAEWSTRQKR